MRGLKFALVGLSATMLVSSCAAPSSPGSPGTSASTTSPRYALFGLEPVCPPTDCDAAFVTTSGEATGGETFFFDFSVVDRQPGPDLMFGTFTLDGDAYFTETGEATVASPLIDIAATLESIATPGEFLDVTIHFDISDNSYSFTAGTALGSGSGFPSFGRIEEGSCELFRVD